MKPYLRLGVGIGGRVKKFIKFHRNLQKELSQSTSNGVQTKTLPSLILTDYKWGLNSNLTSIGCFTTAY